MARVKALYSYTYDYEGKEISFKCGDEFQLLAKANADWWQVRRWIEDSSQDIYVPAVYVKELNVEQEEDPLYANMADVAKQVKAFKEKESSTPPPAPRKSKDKVNSEKNKANHTSEKSLPAVSSSSESKEPQQIRKLVVNFEGKTKEELFIPRTGSGSPIGPKRTHSTKREDSPASPKAGTKMSREIGGGSNLLPVAAKPRSKSINVDKRDSSESPTDMQRCDSPSGGKSLTAPGRSKQPPPVLPKGGRQQARPKSMVMLGLGEGGEDHMSAIARQLEGQMKQRSSPKHNNSKVAEDGGGGGGEGGGGGGGGGNKKDDQSPTVKSPLLKNFSSPQNLGSESQIAVTKPLQNGSLGRDTPTFSTFTSPSHGLKPQQYVLPEGWTEHKTQEGHTYYHNVATGKSSWTRPPSAKKTTPVSTLPSTEQSNNPLEKVAPRGWTKEISPLSQTPIYTSSRTGEKWALAKDGTGSYYYYNMADSSLTVGELPDLTEVASHPHNHPHSSHVQRSVSEPQEHLYDTLQPLKVSRTETEPHVGRTRTNSDSKEPEDMVPSSPSHNSGPGLSHSQPPSMLHQQLEMFHHSLAHMQLKKHGYLQRKRLFDAQGKRAKGGWQKVYLSLDNFQLKFYTDHKVAMETGAKALSTFHLLQATVCTYNKEKKTKHAFLVSSSFGEQFILQADSAGQMNDWYSTLQTAVHKANEDYRLHPDKYADVMLPQDGEEILSPKPSSVKPNHRRKPSRDLMSVMEDDEDLDELESVAEKSDRIRNRLRRLMAKRPQIETLQKKGIIEDPVFGADLSKLCERQKTMVPQFLVQFMEHIESNGMETVGLYRLSGNAASVQKLRCLVEQDQPYNLNSEEWADINIVTGCLKLYFRELPDPLIPARSFQAFIDAARMATTPAQRIAAIAAQVKELPKHNYHTLKTLIQHLRRVMDMGSINKMHSSNIAIVFGPTLLRAEGDPFEMANLAPVQNGIVELMLIEYDKIFKK